MSGQELRRARREGAGDAERERQVEPGTEENAGRGTDPTLAANHQVLRALRFKHELGLTIADPASTDVGRDSVIAVDPATGYLRVGYFDVAHGVVRVLASRDGSTGSGFFPIAASVAAIVARSFALVPIEHWRV